jgi:hypothetical protein
MLSKDISVAMFKTTSKLDPNVTVFDSGYNMKGMCGTRMMPQAYISSKSSGWRSSELWSVATDCRSK